MNTSCGVSGCLDAQAPIKVSFLKLYQWPSSDVEFVKLMGKDQSSTPSRKHNCHESFTCRQRYLRSYTFSKKETVTERTKKWLQEKKEMKKKKKKASDEMISFVKRLEKRSVDASCAVLNAVFECLFSCMARVDVEEFK